MQEFTYYDYCLDKIVAKYKDFNQTIMRIDIELKVLTSILKKHIKEYITYDKTDLYHFKRDNTLEAYNMQCIVSKTIAVMFTWNNDAEPGQPEHLVVNTIELMFKDKVEADKISKEIIKKMLVRTNEDTFYTIGVGESGFILQREKIKYDSNLSLELNYGLPFLAINDEIIKDLTDKTHGIMMFHGDPGTGKTTYIRYLIRELCHKKQIIYVPTYLVEQLANPEFICFIQKQKKSILILEDAENVLTKRNDDDSNSIAVSNLLNITSGLLNDATQMQVIATFNVSKKNIDTALMRPGRLLKMHEFNKLTIEESNKLREHLGKTGEYSTEMSLGEIYNEEIVIRKAKKKGIGIKD